MGERLRILIGLVGLRAKPCTTLLYVVTLLATDGALDEEPAERVGDVA